MIHTDGKPTIANAPRRPAPETPEQAAIRDLREAEDLAGMIAGIIRNEASEHRGRADAHADDGVSADREWHTNRAKYLETIADKLAAGGLVVLASL